MRIVRHARMVALHAVLLCGLAACASQPTTTTYDQLGGAAGIEGIVDDLLEKIVEDERINLQFADADIVRLRSMLIEQLCAESDGPCTYSGLSMRESHAGRGIDNAQFNALVEDLVDVMTARRIPVGAQNRLLKRLAPMHGDIVEP
jgi:hemoglobin